MPDRAASPSAPSAQLPLPRKELRGVVERITYQNPQNGYTVARLAPERAADTGHAQDDDRLVTVVGTLPDLQPGEAIVAEGFWANDPRHGWQFRALDFRTTLPATLQGMKRYLGSGLVKGIGPVMAGRIVDAFGEETFAVIDERVSRLTEIPGIGSKRAERIAATWEEQRHVREVMAALQGYGVSTSLAVRIYKRFKDDSARVIAQEPYRLAREVWGIGFKTADKIAQAVGIAPDSPQRLQAGVLHALGQAADEGHTLLPEPALGGVPHRITYDNLGSAVTKILQGRTRQEHEQFVAFRGHYLFESHFCLPGREGAHEKPLVESLVGYARRNFLVPMPAVDSWDALNWLLAERCAAEDGRTVPGRDRPIGMLWQEEQARLRPVPRHPFACCRTVAVKATRQALVSFERNRYSVPSRYAGERLVLRAFPWHVELSDGQTVVARHPRLYGRDGEQLDPLHYLQVLERKPGGFEGARPIQYWRTTWPPIYEAYLTALRRERPADATREFVRILQLHARYRPEAIAAALEQALPLVCWSADAVEVLIRQAADPAATVVSTLDLTAVPRLAPLVAVTIPIPDLHAFDQLLAPTPTEVPR